MARALLLFHLSSSAYVFSQRLSRASGPPDCCLFGVRNGECCRAEGRGGGSASPFERKESQITMPRAATGVMSAGTVDANGVLWKSTQVGKFTDSFDGCASLYDTLAASAKKNGDKPAAGLRPIVDSTMVGGFEKLTMAKHFEWLTYADYLKQVDDLGAGMVKAIPTHRRRGHSALACRSPCGYPPLWKPARAPQGRPLRPIGEPSPRGCRREAVACPPLPTPPPLAVQAQGQGHGGHLRGDVAPVDDRGVRLLAPGLYCRHHLRHARGGGRTLRHQPVQVQGGRSAGMLNVASR